MVHHMHHYHSNMLWTVASTLSHFITAHVCQRIVPGAAAASHRRQPLSFKTPLPLS